MSHPSATEIYAKMPRKIWFRIPVIVRFMFPELPEYELSYAYAALNTYMNKKKKWGNVVKKRGPKNLVFWCI